MKTKEAKDFLVQQGGVQAARENIPLSDIEKKMMYFTESDPTSCDNPAETNDEFEVQYDTEEYEAKISRLLHHAYDRLKVEDPGGKRKWDQAIGTLRKGDHYLLVLWDQTPCGERPKGDSLRLLGSALVVAAGLVIAIFLAAKYDIDLHGYGAYLLLVIVGFLFLASGTFRRIYRAAVAWFHRPSKGDDEAN
jgi:hypothetical protein